MDISVVLLNGQQVNLAFKGGIVNGTNANKLIEDMKKFEADHSDMPSIETRAAELVTLYGKDKDWWMDNFAPSLTAEIITWASKMIVGAIKNA